MKINPSIFRTYDIRGKYPGDLNREITCRIVEAFCFFNPQVKRIVISRDPRLSSPILHKAAVKTLINMGKEVIDIGIAPDPLFYFSIFHYNLDGGIQVSGSHAPKEYNGLTLNVRKIKNQVSKDIIKEDLQKIKTRVINGQNTPIHQKLARGKLNNLDPSEDYINYVVSKINLSKPLKIVIDSGNGACGFLPEKIFKRLGCEVKTLYGEFNGNFPNHLPDPYDDKNIIDIKEEVLKEKADLGFAFDTDGDRVAPIDNQGRKISGDDCLLMLARNALEKKRGPIVHCMRASKAFLDDMEKRGVKTYFSVSHHNAVIDKIIETRAVFGGEITYHFLFPLDYYLCDEAIFSSLKLALIASEVENFIAFIDALPHYYASPEVFIESDDKEKFKKIKKLQNYLQKNNFNFINIDGARINFPNGWALARASNTSAFIKCRFEGETKKDLIEIEKKSLDIFKQAGITITQKTLSELGLI